VAKCTTGGGNEFGSLVGKRFKEIGLPYGKPDLTIQEGAAGAKIIVADIGGGRERIGRLEIAQVIGIITGGLERVVDVVLQPATDFSDYEVIMERVVSPGRIEYFAIPRPKDQAIPVALVIQGNIEPGDVGVPGLPVPQDVRVRQGHIGAVGQGLVEHENIVI